MLNKKTATEYGETCSMVTRLENAILERVGDILSLVSSIFKEKCKPYSWAVDTAMFDEIYMSIDVWPHKKKYKSRAYLFLQNCYGGLPKEFLWMTDEQIERIVRRDMIPCDERDVLLESAKQKLTQDEWDLLGRLASNDELFAMSGGL